MALKVDGTLAEARNGVIAAGVNPALVIYDSSTSFIGTASNVMGYLCLGIHAGMGGDYARDGKVVFSGRSRWYVIETIESFNGKRYVWDHGNYIDWFSSNAFGGANYTNTPVGAVCHTDEPGGW